MTPDTRTNHPKDNDKRRNQYALTALFLFGCSYWLNDIDWQGSTNLHTLMESLATLLALFVGVLALIRFFSQRDNQFLYIGAGFLGTGLLDAYHTIVTSSYFQPFMPSDAPHLVPWSWMASRLFLSILMFVSWVLWFKHRHNTAHKPETAVVFGVTALATLSSFLFFAMTPLPHYQIDDWMITRPFELLPALFFGLALLGYLYKGAWRRDAFEHWLVLSLIVGLAMQSVFMPFSSQLYDTQFNLAHLLKKLSYILVLTGLLVSLFQTYIELRAESTRRKQAEELALQRSEALAAGEAWFRAVADYTHDWEYWAAPDGKMLYISPACERITGYPPAAFMSSEITLNKILSPHERISAARHLNEIDQQHGLVELDFRILNRAGEERWINHVCLPVFDENGVFIGRRASNRDITAQKLVAFETETLTAALHHSPIAVLIADAEANILYVNPKFESMSGYSLAEIRGKNPRIFQSGEHPAAFYRHLWSSLHAGKTWSGELKNKRRNGELYWEANSITPILDEDAQIKRYVAVKEDITEKRNLRETLYQQAHFDALTRLPNRNLFDDRLEQSLKKVVRNPAAHNMALMLLDLDHFKEVNDSRGHATGDELLKQAAERMRHCIRESDTVGRIGGDEFIILVDGFSEENTPDEIAQRLLKAMQMPFLIFGQNSHISASIGVAMSSSQNLNAETLKKNADVALYEAKGQGRNRVQFFQPEDP